MVNVTCGSRLKLCEAESDASRWHTSANGSVLGNDEGCRRNGCAKAESIEGHMGEGGC